MTQIHIQTLGSGRPLVLIHGWAMHGGVWQDFANGLAKHFRVICVDLPGHGYSQKLTSFTLENICAVLSEAITEPVCCWLGWSMGALVVLEFARRYPDRVNALILLAGNPCFVKSITWPGVLAHVLDSFADNLQKNCQGTVLRFLSLQINTDLPDQKDMLRALRASVQQRPAPDSDTLQAGLEILKNTDLRPVLAQINKPVLAILGTRDTLVPVSIAPCLPTLNSAIEVAVLKKAGHVPFLSHGDDVQSVILEFLAKQNG